ncbi:hypothetical protein ACU4GH_12955 [Bradyrhizobium betae]|uniref:hypothetical protein n=1 Tax=Bradyrhizobium betae TaxID=244734 RepID=UPI003D672231
MRTSEDRSFLVLLGVISVAFGWLLWPFSGALLWATLLAIIFAPLYRRCVDRLPEWRNLAAFSTVVVVVVMVLIPIGVVIASLVDQGGSFISAFRPGRSVSLIPWSN